MRVVVIGAGLAGLMAAQQLQTISLSTPTMVQRGRCSRMEPRRYVQLRLRG
jgi:predicted NAD/FAD-dependent oxidoreductase